MVIKAAEEAASRPKGKSAHALPPGSLLSYQASLLFKTKLKYKTVRSFKRGTNR